LRVYIESNFPLELARRQEEVVEAEELLILAEAGSIELIYPAIALTEPFSTLLRYANERSRLLQTLNQQLRDLARSQSHQPLVANLSAVVASLTALRKDETDLLEQTVDRLLNDLGVTRAEFARRNCRYLAKFAAGLAFVRATISPRP